jgi:hypothetical protein
MKTKVVHCKRAAFEVYIGRPSKWGNPFAIKSESERELVIDQYRKWITKGEGQHLLQQLQELKGKTLGCWCYPKKCHGDVLAELVESHCPD